MQALMVHISRSLEDSPKSYANYKGLAQEISEGRNMSSWTRDNFGKREMRRLDFCHCFET